LVWVATPKAFEATRIEVFVPPVVGVPLIMPLLLFVNPVGRLDPLNVIGVVPLAVTVLLNATPTVPLKALVEVITGGVPIE
jgi:hypothetical protein